MLTLKIIFWICIVLVVYTYVGYGALLWFIIRIKRLFSPTVGAARTVTDEELPQMTLMICAYNEEEVIHEKMENIRQLDYPREKLCVMWITDGSTDRTNELLRQYPEVTLVFSPERRGKAAALEHGLSVNTSPFVTFTDANTMLNAGALREIARQFMKPGVSCVAGEKRVTARTVVAHASQRGEVAAQTAAEGEGLYWRYESALKQWDSDLYSAMGAAGELFAVRMEHYRRPPQNALLDDFMMSMLIVKDGHRIAYTSDAYATEYGSANLQEESKRKRRIAAGGLQSSWWLRSLMNPLRYPKVAFQFVSHRVLRWTITPFAMLALIPLNIALVAMGAGTLYTVILVLQLLFYLAALTGWFLARSGHQNKLLNVPSYFLFMNFNVFLGIRYLMTHSKSGAWEKASRG
ncbi:MAG: glycosyltransferase family 2 protein [Prevotella sp.]|nr:glycosyltransferase family 2 protein [Prevotella sp.]MBR6190479.1 glycosyltransferase family 2 protein [Prevotella sp.]